MNTFTNQDIVNYYDHTEGHMRMFWKLDNSMGLHYGIWDTDTKNLSEAIVNTNRRLAEMGKIRKEHTVLDAGCGVGGSSIYLAKNIGSRCTGITLSARQVKSANSYAAQNKVSDMVQFEVNDYTNTGYADNSYDIVWALETMGTARDKSLFFKEMYRVLKPGGRLLIADWYKSYGYNVDEFKCMQDMLYGWAIQDLLTFDEQKELATRFNYNILDHKDVTADIKKTVNLMYWLCIPGMLGTKLYTLTHPNATHFSRVHYKTGFGQYHAYKKKLWKYGLWILEKPLK